VLTVLKLDNFFCFDSPFFLSAYQKWFRPQHIPGQSPSNFVCEILSNLLFLGDSSPYFLINHLGPPPVSNLSAIPPPSRVAAHVFGASTTMGLQLGCSFKSSLISLQRGNLSFSASLSHVCFVKIFPRLFQRKLTPDNLCWFVALKLQLQATSVVKIFFPPCSPMQPF